MGKIKQNELNCRDTAPLTDIGATFLLVLVHSSSLPWICTYFITNTSRGLALDFEGVLTEETIGLGPTSNSPRPNIELFMTRTMQTLIWVDVN